MENKREITQDEIDLVVARLRAIPDNALISAGSYEKTLSKDELIEEVKNLTDVGREIIEIQMGYLRSFKRG